jgi:hypothetical protein
MIDRLHIPIWKTKKPIAIALSGVGRGLRGRGDGGNINNVQYVQLELSLWIPHVINISF